MNHIKRAKSSQATNYEFVAIPVRTMPGEEAGIEISTEAMPIVYNPNLSN